jgi:DNA-binding LytR/AlgR family response regulator
VEDNAAELANVLDFLAQKCPQVEVVGSSGEIQEAFEQISRTKPDLLISDIQITGGRCYDLLNQLNAVGRLGGLRIIFMTRFRDFDNARDGFEYAPIAFLEKPFSASDLQTAVEKVEKQRVPAQTNHQIELIMELIGHHNQTSQRLTITLVGGSLQLVELTDIVYLEANTTTTHFYLKGMNENATPLSSNRNFGYYKDLLQNNPGFFAISNSILINMQYFDKYDHGQQLVQLKNPTRRLYASRQGGRALRQFMLQNPLPDSRPNESLRGIFRRLFGLD